MFFQNLVRMGGFELNHHWHGINVLSLLECALLAACLSTMLALVFRFVRKSRRLTILSLVGALSFATAAYAANTALSALSASGALAGADLIYVVQTAGVGGVKGTMTKVATFINSLFSGDFTVTSGGVATLKNTGPGATGPIGSTTVIPQVTIDAQGRVTALGSATAAGTVSSVATGCGVTGGPITTTGTISTQVTTRAVTGTTDTILPADCGNRVTESNASPVAVTVPVANGSFTNGYFTEVVNLGAGLVTITPTASTIDGAASLTLTQFQSVVIVSDGSNYTTGRGRTVPGGSNAQVQTNSNGTFGGLTNTQLTALINAATASLPGALPAWPNNTTTFFRGDGTYATLNFAALGGAAAVAQLGASPANHAVPVDVGGTSTYKVIPDCTDTGGNHINYTQSSDAFSCGTSSSGGGSTGTGPAPPAVVNNWYLPQAMASGGVGGAAAAANTIYCNYGNVSQKLTINALGTRVTTLSAGNNLQLAIYANANGRPAALLSSTGNISTTTVAAVSAALGSNQQVGPGSTNGADVWFCRNQDNAVAASLTPFQTNSSTFFASTIGSATLTNVVPISAAVNGVSCAGANCIGGSSTFNTWPATLAASTWTEITASLLFSPVVSYQVTSVP